MAKNTDDAKLKHAKNNPKHPVAVVLQKKWLELNQDKTAADWTIENFKDMQNEYKVTWKPQNQPNTIRRFVKLKAERVSKKPFDGESTFEIEFLLVNTDDTRSSVRMTCAIDSSFMDNLAQTNSPLANLSVGSQSVWLHLILYMSRFNFQIQR